MTEKRRVSAPIFLVMRDPAVKTAVALFVLFGGVCAAMLFRHDRPRTAAADPPPAEELMLRYRRQPARKSHPAESIQPAQPIQVLQEKPVEVQTATIVTPLDRVEPPPALAPSYPEAKRLSCPREGSPMQMMLPVEKPAERTRHTIMDGDTLSSLAREYLGSESRAEELFQANRDVLTDPALLPIGVELKIPPRVR